MGKKRILYTIIIIVACALIIAFLMIDRVSLYSWGAHYYLDDYSDSFITVNSRPRLTLNFGDGDPGGTGLKYSVWYFRWNKDKILQMMKDDFEKTLAEMKDKNSDCIGKCEIKYEKDKISGYYEVIKEIEGLPSDSRFDNWRFVLNNKANLYHEFASGGGTGVNFNFIEKTEKKTL